MRKLALTDGSAWEPEQGKRSPTSRREAEWAVLTPLLRSGSDGDIAAFGAAHPIGARMADSRHAPVAYVARLRASWERRQAALAVVVAEVVADLDAMWLRLDADSANALVGFLALTAKCAAAGRLDGVHLSQREVEATTGTFGQAAWGPLAALECVTRGAPGTIGVGTVHTVTLPVGMRSTPVYPWRPARSEVLAICAHPVVTGKVLTGDALLAYAAIAGGARTVANVAAAWGITARRAGAWVARAAAVGVVTVTKGGAVSTGRPLDEVALEQGVVDARATLAVKHANARTDHRKAVDESDARWELTCEASRTAWIDRMKTQNPMRAVRTTFYDAVDAVNVAQRALSRTAAAITPDLFTAALGDVDVAIELAEVAAAGVTAWAWAHDGVTTEAVAATSSLLAAARRAITAHQAGRGLDAAVHAAAMPGATPRLTERRAWHPLPDDVKWVPKKPAAKAKVARLRVDRPSVERPADDDVATGINWLSPAVWPSYDHFAIAVAVRYGVKPIRDALEAAGESKADLVPVFDAAIVAAVAQADDAGLTTHNAWGADRPGVTDAGVEFAIWQLRKARRGLAVPAHLAQKVYPSPARVSPASTARALVAGLAVEADQLVDLGADADAVVAAMSAALAWATASAVTNPLVARQFLTRLVIRASAVRAADHTGVVTDAVARALAAVNAETERRAA